MKITICVGSTCHLLGSKTVVERFKELVEEHKLGDKVELAGKFCMGKCGEGVCVTIDEDLFSVTPDTVNDFFKENVLTRV